MKSRRQKISILFVPEGEGRSRNITLSRGTIRFLLICFVVFLIFILAGSVSYFFLSVKASRYDMTVVENLKLIEENRRIVKLAQDLEKLKTFNRQIRKVMGVPLNLDSTVIDTVISEFNSDNIWQTQNFFGLSEPVFSIPVEGVVSRGYSVGIYPRITHQGTDFACKEGNIVSAASDGWVVFTGHHYRYGNLLILQHPGDFLTYYGHNKNLLVNLGEKVNSGQPIAVSGNSGLSTAPHLHFEIRKRGAAVDPAVYIKELEQVQKLENDDALGGQGE